MEWIVNAVWKACSGYREPPGGHVATGYFRRERLAQSPNLLPWLILLVIVLAGPMALAVSMLRRKPTRMEL
jgi:hypothetical protein